MPVFKVRRRVDAYVDYVADVEADTPRAAAELASDDEGQISWAEEGPCEFDTRLFIALDRDGFEIAESEIRD